MTCVCSCCRFPVRESPTHLDECQSDRDGVKGVLVEVHPPPPIGFQVCFQFRVLDGKGASHFPLGGIAVFADDLADSPGVDLEYPDPSLFCRSLHLSNCQCQPRVASYLRERIAFDNQFTWSLLIQQPREDPVKVSEYSFWPFVLFDSLDSVVREFAGYESGVSQVLRAGVYGEHAISGLCHVSSGDK